MNMKTLYAKCGSLVFGIAATMSLRFSFLYSNVLFEHDYFPSKAYAYIQYSFLFSTVLAYVATAYLGLLVKRERLSFANVKVFASALLICSLGMVVFTANIEQFSAHKDLCFYVAIGCLSASVAFMDMVYISHIRSFDQSFSCYLVALGFGLGALFSLLLSYIPLVFAHLAILLMCVVNVCILLQGKPCHESLEANIKFRGDFIAIALPLCVFSFITGNASRLFSNPVFGADLRQPLVLFAIILAMLLIVVGGMFWSKYQKPADYSMLSTLLCVVALIMLPFMDSSFDLVISFVLYAAFFIALISARSQIASHARASDAGVLIGGGLLFALCQSTQVMGYGVGSYLRTLPYQKASLFVFASGAFLLSITMLYFGIRKKTQKEKFSNSLDRSVSTIAASSSFDYVLKSFLETYQLTKREGEVLSLLIEGRTRNSISSLLVISPHTAKTHIQSIYRKCSCSGKQELIDRWLAYKDDIQQIDQE